MLTHLFAIAALAVCLAALTGWGGLTHRLCGGRERVPWTYRAALGLPTLALAGGLLNLLKAARAWALDALVVAGLLLLAWQASVWLRERRAGAVDRAPGRAARGVDLLPRVLIGGAALFLVVNLLPTGVFNPHDDLHKYMVPPLRMLATGTLGGNPFETTGFYSVGFQSYFQAFGVAHFPLVYLNAFDAVLCFLLTGLLLDDLGRRMGVAPHFRALGALVLVVINPQYVNISSVFSGSLAFVGLAASAILLGERIRVAPSAAVARAAVPVGLFAVLLMGLKLTHLPFAGLFLVILLALLLHLAGGWRGVAPAVGGFLAGAAALGAPWMALYEHTFLGPLGLFLRGFLVRVGRRLTGTPPPAPDGAVEGLGAAGSGAPAVTPPIAQAASAGGAYLDQAPLAFGLVTLAVGVVCVLAVTWLIRHRRDGDRALKAELAVAVAAGASLVAYYLAIPFAYSVTQGIRYIAPLLIPTAALSVLVAARLAAGSARAGLRGLALGTCTVLLAGLFVPDTVHRVVKAVRMRSLVSFPIGPMNQNYHRFAFHGSTRNAYRAAQARIPPGAPILAWVATPFHLDFRRNPIHTIPDPDFCERWIGLPLRGEPADLSAFLLGRGIRYVIWDYNTPGMRSDASLKEDLIRRHYAKRGELTLHFKSLLASLEHAGEVGFDNGHVVVFNLPGP